MRRVRILAGLAALACPGLAHAQRAAENALNSADDAFGSSVGLENTGIYSESDTRGFSPTKAGNVRIDGVYYDPVGSLSSRLRIGNVVRIGFAAEEYPFQAPTGIVEYRLPNGLQVLLAPDASKPTTTVNITVTQNQAPTDSAVHKSSGPGRTST